jgi:Ca-activated chloride channel family protein
MSFNPDDPKWTAYVLGEVSAAERAELEKELEGSAGAREAVEEIRVATSFLKDELAKETGALLPEQRRAVANAVAPRRPRARPVFRWALAAASLVTAVVVLTTSFPQFSRQTAELMPPAIRPLPDEGRTAGLAAVATQAAGDREKLGVLKDETSAMQQGQQGQAGPQQSLPQEARLPGVLGGVLRGQPAGQGGAIAFDSFAANKTLVAPSAVAESLADRVDRPRFNTESYDFISDNPFVRVSQDTLATFSIDVDTASYSNLRRFLTMNQLPPKDSVRIEEMINYFTYDYPSPTGRRPIGIYTEVAAAPWQPDHRLVRIGIKARDIDISRRPPSNLVFLIDVSGSMATPEKLPLLQSALKLMVQRLGEGDHVAIVTYAGASGLQLPSTSGDKKEIINAAIESLSAGGSTNGASGILLAYETANSNFIRGGINRVVLATDGDFNVGITNQGDLTRLIEDKAKSGVFLSVLGFGMGDYKDSTLEKLADKGNGNYAYIDTLNEARKVLVEEMSGTLMTVAKDVKIQVEFNPAEVNAYRLIGYENRALRHEDFNDDNKDAGDMGAGQTVTALFEIVPRGVEIQTSSVDRLKYQQVPQTTTRRGGNGELLNLKIRYKEPEGNTSQLMESPVVDRTTAFNNASPDFRFAAAVASFGMILRDSPYKGQWTMEAVIDTAERSKAADRNGHRDEFVQMVKKARTLKGTP